MSKIHIEEGFGNVIESYEDISRHHQDRGRESGRDYAIVAGEEEEVRRLDDGRVFVKKDLALVREDTDSDQGVPVPSPATGYVSYLNDSTNTVIVYDRPYVEGEPEPKRLAMILHMDPNQNVFQEGQRVEYGQPIGVQSDFGSPGATHLHVEAENEQLMRYVADINRGALTTEGSTREVSPQSTQTQALPTASTDTTPRTDAETTRQASSSSDFAAQLASPDLADTPIYRAIGLAEGTIAEDGSHTPGYYGHGDPGNGQLNRGFGSYQVFQHELGDALTPEQADRVQADRLLNEAWPRIEQGLDASGFPPGPQRDLVAANALDLWNQAPAAFDGANGFVNPERLGDLRERLNAGADPAEAIRDARVASYYDDNGLLQAGGFRNDLAALTADQERRASAVAHGLELTQDQRFEAPQTGAPAANASEATRLLREGDSGQDVRGLQERLNAQGVQPPLAEDGAFGSQTERAVMQFQAQHGLEVDGIVGPQTRAALNPVQATAAVPQLNAAAGELAQSAQSVMTVPPSLSGAANGVGRDSAATPSPAQNASPFSPDAQSLPNPLFQQTLDALERSPNVLVPAGRTPEDLALAISYRAEQMGLRSVASVFPQQNGHGLFVVDRIEPSDPAAKRMLIDPNAIVSEDPGRRSDKPINDDALAASKIDHDIERRTMKMA
jgi:peptidoglycan hydrolase-like protein with peptidoglycan-binding domain